MQGLVEALNAAITSRWPKNRYIPQFEVLEDRLTPSGMVFTVNTTIDDPLGPTTPGLFSLRDAVNAVNADAGDNAANPDVIAFAIPGMPTISLTANLPALLRPVFIDGSTQAGGVAIHGNRITMLDVESLVSVKNVT